MKKKILSILITVLLLCTCIFTLAACGEDPESPHSHSYVDTIIAPTCTEKGYTLHKCDCGEEYADTQVNALGHNFEKYVSDNNATFTSDGTKTATCSRQDCNETHTVIDIGSKLEETSPFVFEEYGSGYALTNYTGTDSIVTVPSTYNGKSVVAIGSGSYTCSGFYNNTQIKNIILPNSVLEINDEAFYGCYSLEGIEMPSVLTIKSKAFENCYNLLNVDMPNIVSIDSYAFYNCALLEEITIPKTCVSVGFNAYYGCNSIRNLTIENITNINLSGSALSFPSDTICVGGSGELPCLSSTGVRNVVVLDGITIIGDNCFSDCINLQTIVIPTSVNEIGQKAFYNCTKLQSVNLPNSLCKIGAMAFYNCASLEEVILPKSLTEIQDSAFKSCSKLESVVFEENGSIEISSYAFYDCSSLIDVDMKNSITSIGENAFECCSSITTLKIPNSVKYIGESAFMSCDKLEDISIPFVGTGEKTDYTTRYKDVFGYIFGYKKSSIASYLSGTVRQISVEGFYYGFYIPRTIRKVYIEGGDICAYAFNNCNFIIDIELGDNVNKIDNFAFAHCSDLKNLTIGKGLSEIDKYEPPFDGCSSLENISIDSDNEYYASIEGNLYSKDKQTLKLYAKGKKDTSFITPSYIVNIDYYAFSDCYFLKNITITDNVTNIEAHAFDNCHSLKNITLGNGITHINNYAFANCSALDNIELENSLKFIGQFAFYNCISLVSIVIPDSVEEIDYKAFYGCSPLLTIYCRTWSKPNGWSYGWNLRYEDDYGDSFVTVHWGYKGE